VNIKKLLKRKKSFAAAIVFLFLLFGLSILIVFNEQVFIHDYLNFYLLPFFSLAGALVLERIFSKRLLIFLGLLLTLGIFFERKVFLDTLQKREAEKPYVELAFLINQKSKGDKRFLIEANNFYNFAYPFLWNYGYGQYIDGKSDDLDLFLEDRRVIEKNYDFIVTVDTHPVEDRLKELLDENYKKEEEGVFNFYIL